MRARSRSWHRLFVLSLAAGACGSGGGGGGNTGGTGGGGPVTLDGPCSLDTRVGGFAVELHPATTVDAAFASVAGSVRNGVLPTEAWHPEGDAAGGCRMMVGPGNACTPACALPQICGLGNQCIAEPTAQDVGEVTVTGVGGSALALTPVSPAAPVYSGTVKSPYPPFAPGAAVHLRAAGATLPAFTLDGQGFEPLAFEGTGLTVTDGQAFSFSWTAPASAGSARIFAVLEIGHHGGVNARVECDLPDTGSAEVPAAIVSAVVAKGVHGFPTLTLSRRTADSTTIAPGCVDFTVASPVDRTVGVCTSGGTCVTSCSCGGALSPCTGAAGEAACPSGKTCQSDFTCV
jgi:hypothetical protein